MKLMSVVFPPEGFSTVSVKSKGTPTVADAGALKEYMGCKPELTQFAAALENSC
jgi:hypothetical protein